MDKVEARGIVAERIERLRRMTYDELASRVGDQVQCEQVISAKGIEYHLEDRVMWDDDEGGNLRVAAWIHDGGLRTLWPIRDDFILAPDGSFVGK